MLSINSIEKTKTTGVKLGVLFSSLLTMTACVPDNEFWVEKVDQRGSKKLWLEVSEGESAILAWDITTIEEKIGAIDSMEISPAPAEGVIDPATGSLEFIPGISSHYTAEFVGADKSLTDKSGDVIVLREYCSGIDSVGMNYSQQLDLQLPDETLFPGPNPAVLLIHPGSWKTRDYSDMYRYMPAATDRGYVAVSINYRLSEEDKMVWPGHIQDAKCAVRWLRENAATYNIDPNAIAAIGHSAGGHLAALLGVTDASTDPTKQSLIDGFKNKGNHLGYEDNVQAVVTIAGPHHLESSYHEGAVDYLPSTSDTYTLLLGELPVEGVYNETYDQASPTYFVDSESADTPYLIINSINDQLVSVKQGCRLRKALADAGSSNVTMLLYPSGRHESFIEARNIDSVVTGGNITKTINNSFAFLDHHLRATDDPNYENNPFYTDPELDDLDCDNILQ
ncbi:MAG: alpha/beta hydrolase [Pseudomonadales bacterium]|nr:alpha/beta hydrolase [Pseudomonadales bacterium]